MPPDATDRRDSPAAAPVVTVVLVAHDGATWLPRTLGALAAQTRVPDVVVGVDTGSTDGSHDLLAAALGPGHVVVADRGTGFGDAVRLGLAAAPPPDPTAGPPVRAELPPPAHVRHRTTYDVADVAATVGPHLDGRDDPADVRKRAPDDADDVPRFGDDEQDDGFDASSWSSDPFGDHPDFWHEPLDPEAPVAVHDWVWLLHDDVEADPRALEMLLAEVARSPSIGIIGPKIRGWYDRRLLLEVGVTIARSGRRETLLERREQDQGQHDGTRQVLAVSTAGMLVRRDVWDELGGLDPALPLLRDDVDLGWRATVAGHRVVCTSDAVVHHAEAAAHTRRPIDVRVHGRRRRLHRLDRQHAMYVLLANTPAIQTPLVVLRLAVGTVLRALGLLIGKLPTYALDEVLALLAVAGRPDRMIAARRRRRTTRSAAPRDAGRLLAPRGSGWRHLMETVNLLVGPGPAAAAGGAHRAVETGPTAEEAEDLPWGSSLVSRLATRPGTVAVALLTLLALVAARSLLAGGRLMGGALLPAPDEVGDLWRTYTETWHPVGVGSTVDAPPYFALVAGLGALLLGHLSLAVDVLLLAAVPLAALGAFVALRRWVPSTPIRLWAATTYALLPPVLGSVAAGRLSTPVVAAVLPWAAIAAGRAVGRRTRPGSIRWAWGAGLLLAVVAAFAPYVYLLVLVLLVGAALACWRRALPRADLPRLGVIALVPPLLLLPWLPAFVARPSLLVAEAGLPGPGLSDADLPPLATFLLHPGGPAMYPLVLSAAVLLAALAALLRRDHRRLVLLGWAVGLVGLAGALVQTRLRVGGPALATDVPAWSGPALQLAGGGLLLAAAAGALGARARLVGTSFGWRQPVAVVLVVLAVLSPVLAAAWWVARGADDPLQRRDPVLLPAFVAAEGQEPARPRTLVLRRRGDGSLAYALLREEGPRLGDAETAPDAQSRRERVGLDAAVADLASGRGGDAAAALLPYGVRFLLLADPFPARLARDIDAVPGMVRVSGPGGSVLWRILYPSGRLRVLGDRSDAAARRARVLPSGQVGARTRVPAGDRGRLLVLADRRDPGWHATLDGRPLPPTTYAGWAQAWRLPAGGGRLVLGFDAGLRPALLWTQGIVLLLVVVLLLPSARPDESEDTAEGAEGSAEVPAAREARAAAAAGSRRRSA